MLSCVLSTCFALVGARAHAQDLSSCGDIRLEAQVQCELVPPSASCEAQCTPLKVQAQCAADLYVDCKGQCNAELEASCSASCEADCSASCEVDPGKFSCYAECEGGCSADCSAKCAADSNSAQCEASCRATCKGSCSADCDVVPPSADCNAQCKASCEGSCQAKANIDCQIDCQAGGYVDCEANVQGGCEVDCRGTRGALFCDGQYVDPRDSIDACVEALKSQLDIDVSGFAEGDAACDGGTCVAEASVGASGCSLAGSSRGSADGLVGFGMMAVGLVWRRRRSGR